MHERIYTIPVNTAFEQHDDCPFCLLYKQLEATEIDLITGASMMEPDVRVRTNKLGFCRHHFDMMYENQKRLSLALTIQSHLEELKKEIVQASMRAMNHMLFGLRDEVSGRTFRECLDGLEKVYGEG